MLSLPKYAELFPRSRNVTAQAVPIFFDYAQDWLDSLQIVEGTRVGYRTALQIYWIPYLASMPMDAITSVHLRKVVNDIQWPSLSRRKGVLGVLTTIFDQAMADEIIVRNPVISIPGAKVPKREINPSPWRRPI